MFRRERKLQSHPWLPGEEGGRHKKTRRNWKNPSFSTRSQHRPWKDAAPWRTQLTCSRTAAVVSFVSSSSTLPSESPGAEERAVYEATPVPEEVVNLVIGVFLRHFCIFDRNYKVLNLIKQCCEPANPLQSTACLKAATQLILTKPCE